MDEIMERVSAILDAAEIEAVSVFDRCIVMVAHLENDVVLAESHVFERAEDFDHEVGVRACLQKIMGRVYEMESAAPIELTKHQARVIVALAESNIGITEAAKKLNYHRNTMVYHINKIRKTTGKDPMHFFELFELLVSANKVLTEE